MKKKTIIYRKLEMEKVKTKVWKVKLNVPIEIPSKDTLSSGKTIEWSFKMILN